MTFTADSYWNTPLPPDVAKDGSSARFIRWIREHNRGKDYLSLAVGDWAMPVIRPTAADPLITVDPAQGATATFRMPTNAEPMPTNDAAMTVLDATTNQDISMFEFDPDTRKAQGLARYWLDSEGIDERIGGTKGNRGHRGVPGAVSCIRREHLYGTESNRLKISIQATAESHVFPMVDHEDSEGGIIPEGMVIRIKPSVDLLALGPLTVDAYAIANMLKRYGAVIGDNGGLATLKVERGITTVRADSLKTLRWSAFEFIERGWRP